MRELLYMAVGFLLAVIVAPLLAVFMIAKFLVFGALAGVEYLGDKFLTGTTEEIVRANRK